MGHLKSGQGAAVPGQAEKLSDVIRRLAALGEQLLPKVEDIKVTKYISSVIQDGNVIRIA